jgi:hypothetical protein
VSTPTPEERSQAADALAQFLKGSGMDPDEADDLAEYAIENAESMLFPRSGAACLHEGS